MLEEAGLLEGVYIGKSASHATRVAPLFLVLYSCLARQSSVVFFFTLASSYNVKRKGQVRKSMHWLRDQLVFFCCDFKIENQDVSRTFDRFGEMCGASLLGQPNTMAAECELKESQKPMGSFLIVCII